MVRAAASRLRGAVFISGPHPRWMRPLGSHGRARSFLSAAFLPWIVARDWSTSAWEKYQAALRAHPEPMFSDGAEAERAEELGLHGHFHRLSWPSRGRAQEGGRSPEGPRPFHCVNYNKPTAAPGPFF